MIILYGALAICSGLLTTALLWPAGPVLALFSAPFAGALAILAVAIARFATAAPSRQEAVPTAQARQRFPKRT